MVPGEYLLRDGNIECNADKPFVIIKVTNTGDRPVQVGSHYHFFEINAQMSFFREEAFGMRLNIPAGTAVRFEPGEEKEVELIPFGGLQQIHGFSGLLNAASDARHKEQALANLSKANFKNM